MQNWPKNLLRGQVYLYQREKLDQQRLVLPEIRKTRDTYVIMTSLLCFRLDYSLTFLLSCSITNNKFIHLNKTGSEYMHTKCHCFRLNIKCVVLSKIFLSLKHLFHNFLPKLRSIEIVM